MILADFKNERDTKNINDIIENDGLTTMEKLNSIIGDNYFTNANRAKGIYCLIQHNEREIKGNNYMSSVFEKQIKENCLQDFKRIASQNDKNILPDNIKKLIDERHIENDER